MQEPTWLTSVQVRMLHAESLRLFGGGVGLRDANLLESAIARPKHLFAYGDNPSLFELAAEYALGLARNQAFVDGKKRVALLAVRAFLFVNGFCFAPDQVETVTTFERLAAGRLDQRELSDWIKRNAVPRR